MRVTGYEHVASATLVYSMLNCVSVSCVAIFASSI